MGPVEVPSSNMMESLSSIKIRTEVDGKEEGGDKDADDDDNEPALRLHAADRSGEG